MLDQFYTKPEIAKQCVQNIKENYNFWVEPSAGNGSFYNFLPTNKRIGIDIDPQHHEIIKLDFLDYNCDKDNVITIGNPPFGYRAQGAIEFFNKAAIFSDTIAFIVPRSFRKAYIINQLNPFFHLADEVLLNTDIFEPSTKTRCIWVVYKRKAYKRKKVILPTSHPDFKIIKQGKGFNINDADFGIRRTGFNTVGEVRNPKECLPITQFIFIKGGNMEDFGNLDLSCAYDTALSPTFTQGELINAYFEYKKQKKTENTQKD